MAFSYDPWAQITTRNGYACDEVISSLQKCIRRGKEEEACMFAYELYISSPQLEEKMWRRLLTISVTLWLPLWSMPCHKLV